MKKVLALFGAIVVACAVTGCKEEASPGFMGSWVEQNTNAKQPRYLDIKVDQGVYHVDERVSVGGIYKVLREVAKVESDNVLSVKNGFRTLTLENGVLYYRTMSFVRVP